MDKNELSGRNHHISHFVLGENAMLNLEVELKCLKFALVMSVVSEGEGAKDW